MNSTPYGGRKANRTKRFRTTREVTLGHRVAGLKLEALEERTLLSTTRILPAPSVPAGLGLAYSNLARQAHNVGAGATAPNLYDPAFIASLDTASPQSVAELEAYLRGLRSNWDDLSNATSTIPSQFKYRGLEHGAPFPSPSAGFVPPPEFVGLENDSSYAFYSRRYSGNIKSTRNQIRGLANDPAGVTGLSAPAQPPAVFSGFAGMNFLDSVDGYVPPGADLAVGPQFVVETVNAQIQFYHKETGRALLPNTPLADFFGRPEERPFDPVVTYSDISQRYVVAAPTLSGSLLLAASRSSNPLEGFQTYKIDVGSGGYFPDDPRIGWNGDQVVLTLNMYPAAGPVHVQVLAFATGSLFGATPPATLTAGIDYFAHIRDDGDFALAPAKMHGAAAGSPMYLVQEDSFAGGDAIRVVTASDLLSAQPRFVESTIPVSPYTAAPKTASQPGGLLATGDSRIVGAAYRDGRLVAAHTVGSPFDADTHVRWYELDVTARPRLVQEGTLDPGLSTDTYAPAIAIGAGGVIALSYLQSSPGENPTLYVTGRTAADPAGTMQRPTRAKVGETYADFTSNSPRWADRLGIAVDPSNPAKFWTVSQHGSPALSGLPGNWETWITGFQLNLTVVASDPAAGSVVIAPPPSAFSLTFSEPISTASVVASDFQVKGIGADSAVVSADGLTVTYLYATSPVTTQGVVAMVLPEGVVRSAADDKANAPFTANFFYLADLLQVVATSPAVGSTLEAPVTNLVLQFNRAFDPYSIDTSDFQVSQGTVVSARPLTNKAIDLTLAGVTRDDFLTLEIPQGALKDPFGGPNLAFSGTYIIDLTTAPFPTDFFPKPPAGSLVYDPSVTGSISFAGDVDSYTLALAANQTLTLILETDAGLTGTVAVYDPVNTLVASATAAGPGQTVILPTAPVSMAGIYTLAVSGSGIGGYTLRAILNADLDAELMGGPPNNSIDSAQGLDAGFASLGIPGRTADRAAVLGSLAPLTSTIFYAGFEENADGFTVDNFANGLWHRSQGRGLQPGHSPTWSFYYGQGETIDGGGNYDTGTRNAGRLISPSIAIPSSGKTILTFNYVLQTERFLPFDNASLQVSSDGISWSTLAIYSVNAESSVWRTSDPVDLSFLAGQQIQLRWSFDTLDNFLNFFEGWYVDDVLVQNLASDVDYYKFSLDTGQSASVAIKNLPTRASIALYDPAGNLLALPDPGAKGLDGIISNFVATTGGEYVIQVTGEGGEYNLVVTRGADFNRNASGFNSAQKLDGVNAVLGAISTGGGALFTLDDNIYYPPFPIWPTDPATGLFTPPPIPAPASTPNNPFGLNMAYDGNFIYYNDGAFFGTGTLYKLEAATGAVVASTTPSNGFTYTGLAYFGGKVYAAAAFDPNIYVFDAATLAFAGTITTGISDSAVTGLAGDPDRGSLWAVGQPNRVYEINPTTGAVIRSGNLNSRGLNEQGMGYLGGELFVSATNGFGAFGGTNVIDVYDSTTLAFKRRMPVSVFGLVSGLAGDGIGGTEEDWYQFNVNAGDSLVIETTTPGGPSGSGLQFVNDFVPNIRLYDEAGNLIAENTGGAADGRNARIAITAASKGSYRVQVSGVTSESVGEYTLSIQGATAGAYPFEVVSTSPPAGSNLNFQPTTLTVNLNNSLLVPSAAPTTLEIDGQVALGVTLVNPRTLVYSLPPLVDGVHSVLIAGLTDIHGTALTPLSFSFTTDTTAPFVVASSISNGEIFAPGTITEIVTFSEPMNPARTTASSFLLTGIYRTLSYAPASFSWSADATQLTITYDNLPSDVYNLVLFASGFADLAGNTLASDFQVAFAIEGEDAVLTGLKPINPVGSLVYQGTTAGVLIAPGDANEFSLALDPRQTLAVLVAPPAGGVSVVTLVAPSGNVIGTAASPEPGKPALIKGVQSARGGTYRIQVSGDVGLYTLQVVLNALIDPAAYGGPPNNSIASAQPIDPYANKFIGSSDRTAVLGVVPAGGGGGGGTLYATDRSTQGLYTVDRTTGAATLVGPLTYFTSFSDLAIDPATGIAYISDVLDPFTFQWSLATIDLATGQQTIIGPQFDTDIHAIVFRDGTLYGFSYSRGLGVMDPTAGFYTPLFPFNTMPEPIEDAAIDSATGTIYGIGQFSGSVYTIDVATGTASLIGSTGVNFNFTVGMAFTAGTLYALGNDTSFTPENHLFQVDPATAAATLIGPNGLMFQPDAMDTPPSSGPPVGNPYAVYSFTLNQGQSASIAIESLNRRSVQFSLLDDQGNLLAISYAGAANYSAGINNFVARDDGTYYIQVSGRDGATFNLVVTRGADFDTEKNNSLETAQSLTGNTAVLGAITKGLAPLFTLDDNLYFPPFPIWPTNPETGVFVPPSIPAPATTPNNPFGLNMAYDGSFIYYSDGAFFGSGALFKIDATTGSVVTSVIPANGFTYTGLAYLNGKVYAGAAFDPSIYVFDAATLASLGSIFTGISDSAITGLAGDPDRGVLWAVGQTNRIYKIDPATGTVLMAGFLDSQGLNEQGLGYLSNELYVSVSNGLGSQGGRNAIDVYDPDTLALKRRLPVAVEGFVSGLAGDGIGLANDDTDYYAFNAAAGATLVIKTSTPAGGPNEFVNQLYPALKLFDPAGNLIAVASGNAADGRNSEIVFTVPEGAGGTWIVQVLQSTLTETPTIGEYGLSITGGSSLADFSVVSSVPASGALVQPPTTYTTTFSGPVYVPSLDASDLALNGVPASGFELVDAFTVVWTIPAGVIPPGNRVLNTAVIPAGAIEDVSGAPLALFNGIFITDTVAPFIVSSSVQDGDVFSPAPYTLSQIVTFSEPMNPAATSASSFSLVGLYRGASYSPAAILWSGDGTELTITYDALPDDVYVLTLFAGGFQDLVGLSLTSDEIVNFAVAVGTAPFPVPFTPILPLGSLVYTGSDRRTLVTATDVNNLTLELDGGQTLSLVVTPTLPGQQLVVQVLDPSSTVVGSAVAAAGKNAVIQTAPIATGGTYTIQISDAAGTLGLYSAAAYLNLYLGSGASNLSIETAEDISGSSVALGSGAADRMAVLGSLPAGVLEPGSVFVASRFYGFYVSFSTPSAILQFSPDGQLVQAIPVPIDPFLGLSDIVLNPVDNLLYAAVTTSVNSSTVSGALLKFDPATGAYLGAIQLPDDPANNFYYYPYGFAIAADGTFWIPQPNSGNIIHVDAAGNLLASFATGLLIPESAGVRADGQVYISGFDPSFQGQVVLLDPSTATVAPFTSAVTVPQLTTIAGSGGVWVGDYFNPFLPDFGGALQFDDLGTLQRVIGYLGSQEAQDLPSGNIWNSNFEYSSLFLFDAFGNFQNNLFVPGALGLSVWGVDNPNIPPVDQADYYRFELTGGQSATIAATALGEGNVVIRLLDAEGNVLATGSEGSSNVSQAIRNFVAPTSGTYYVEVTGSSGVRYTVTVTRAATFDLEPNDSPTTAQPLTGTSGVLGSLTAGGNLTISANLEGIDFFGSSCGCLPPDTNAAVGGNHVIETTNFQIKIWEKSTGTVVYDQPLATFFGLGTFGDPYVVFDEIVNRWYVTAFAANVDDLLLAVSLTSNPLDGFLPTYVIDASPTGAIADYPKMGYNADAIVITYNEFGNGLVKVAAVNKAQALAGALSFNISTPPAQFRAMPAAMMRGSKPGDPMWFLSVVNGSGNTLRVTKMTDVLSASPVYTVTELPITPYGPGGAADQPGGPGSVTNFPSTTTTQVDFRDGIMVTAIGAAFANDGFRYVKVGWYQVDVSSGVPVLVREGIIDPGPGVTAQQPSVAIDIKGNLGFTWMQSSLNEYVSMYVATLDAVTGELSTFAAAPGLSFMGAGFRVGDYSTVVVDPADGLTFWAANEYVGADGFTNIWNTKVTAFSLPPARTNDWYSINIQAGSPITLMTSTPADGIGQFVNELSLQVELYDTFGNLVAEGTKLPDGRNEFLVYMASISGEYRIRVFNEEGSSGDYFLQVETAAYAAGGVSGTVYNDLSGDGSRNPGDPGLNNWVVTVYDANGVAVAAQATYAGGQFQFGGLEPGVYLVAVTLQSGFLFTAPPIGAIPVVVDADSVVSGLEFGVFQLVTLAGLKFDDLNGDGVRQESEPGLPFWSINLRDASGTIVATTTTNFRGEYRFEGVGPGTYSVEETSRLGWVQTSFPETYVVTTTSGQNVGGLFFGNFRLVTLSGVVYDDTDGDGSRDEGEPGLSGWTVNLYDLAGSLVATQRTNRSGEYRFRNLGPGKYTVEEVRMRGWYQTDPASPFTHTVIPTSGVNQDGLDFGNFKLVRVVGRVYDDQNGNGVRNPGEPGLAGWTVQLKNEQGNIVATTVTGASGFYFFLNLFPGTFVVEQVVQPGWVQTQPAVPPVYMFTTQSGQNLRGLDFGNFQPGSVLSPFAVIDNLDEGFSKTGSWVDVRAGYDGGSLRARTTDRATATATATWNFAVPAALFDVYITYLSAASYSTAAPYSVFDGTTLLASFLIDQTIPPDSPQGGLTNGNYGGVGWLRLGSFTAVSGNLIVTLTNQGPGTFVNADAALLVSLGGGAPIPAGNGRAKGEAVPIESLGSRTFVVEPLHRNASSRLAEPPKPEAVRSVVLGGIRQPAPVRVVYQADSEAERNAAIEALFDEASEKSNKKGKGGDAIASLARALLDG